MGKSVFSFGHWLKTLCIVIWYDYIASVALGLFGVWVELTTQPPVLNIDKMEKQTGAVAVISGGPRGLAVGILKRLLQLDFNVIMGISPTDVEASQKRLDEFQKLNTNLPVRNVTLIKMDLKSLISVRNFADIVLSKVSRIDLLICNACVMGGSYQITEDTYERIFQVNYLGQFLLTNLLQEKLKSTGKAKRSPTHIIYLCSLAYYFASINFNELENSTAYSKMRSYYTAKVCQLTSMVYLEKQFRKDNSPVHCYAVHPGMIPTTIWYDYGGSAFKAFGDYFGHWFRNVDDAACTILWPAFAPEFQNKGGFYMEGRKSVKIQAKILNEETQFKLYTKSLYLIRDKDI